MTDGVERQTALVSAMLEPTLYPHSPEGVELRETNTSWVFLAGDLAYKVKKAVSFPFLDYGTVERRHEMCREEIRLNRRLAPRIYLRVVGIAREGDRYVLTADDHSNAVEYAIEMRRVEEERSLEALIRGGRLDPGDVDPVARRLARFHGDAAVAPRRFQRPDVLVESLEENLRTLREAGILTARRLDAAQRFTQAFVAANRRRLEARARGGMVRECHGDLRAEHVIVPAHGDVYVYDCLEFNPDLRNIDVASDLSFLIMDLGRLGADDLASRLLAVYRRSGGDAGDDSLIAFFASFRAWVRAKLACLAARDAARDDSERTRSEGEAREFLRLGHRFAWSARPHLVLAICGVAGSGKSTLARELGAASGWPRVSSDLTRKRLAGVPPTARAGPRHYTSEFSERTYREMGRSTRRLLEQGTGVIVDATFHRRDERDAFRAGLGHPDARLRFAECRASAEILAARVDNRASKPERVSDADQSIVETAGRIRATPRGPAETAHPAHLRCARSRAARGGRGLRRCHYGRRSSVGMTILIGDGAASATLRQTRSPHSRWLGAPCRHDRLRRPAPGIEAAGGASRSSGSTARLPDPSEALYHLAQPRFSHIELNVDVKGRGCESALVQKLREHGLVERFLIWSQSPDIVETVRTIAADARTATSIGGYHPAGPTAGTRVPGGHPAARSQAVRLDRQ